MSKMYEFLPVISNKNTQEFQNNQYLPDILMLFDKHSSYLTDDYYSNDPLIKIMELIAFINSLNKHFYAIVKKSNKSTEFMGFVFLDDFHGSASKLHSCTLTTCFCKKFWGREVIEVAKFFIDWVYREIKPVKIKAAVFVTNYLARKLLVTLGFSLEAELKNETLKNGEPVDVLVFTAFRGAV